MHPCSHTHTILVSSDLKTAACIMAYESYLIQICVLIIPLLLFSGVEGQYASSGVRLSLRGIDYPNNSIITIGGIGTDLNTPDAGALQCITDYRPCCVAYGYSGYSRRGEWYYPNGTQTSSYASGGDFFRTRGYGDGTINLFRRNTGIVSPIGSYCCEIPDIVNASRTLCANLGRESY